MKAESRIVQGGLGALTVGARLRDFVALSKPRVTGLVWTTTFAGMVLAGGFESAGPWLFFHMLLGSWLVIASANALNQVLEVEPDSRMVRTMDRPLPSGRLSVREGLAAGAVWGGLGLAQLALFVNPLTAALGAASIALYAFAYTPLKLRTHLCTAIGAVPGAIPPAAGWAAVRGELDLGAFLLFAIQFFWQFPHFWAIACLNRDDYKRAGFLMAPFPGAEAKATAMCALQYSLPLLPLSALFAMFLSNKAAYILGAAALSLWFAFTAARFYRSPGGEAARRLLGVSVSYLPLLMLLMILTR